MKKLVLLAVGLNFATYGFSQFTDTTSHYINYAAAGVINKTNNSRSYVFSSLLKFAIHRKRISLNSAGSWVYGWQQNHLTNNDFSTSLDFNVYKLLPRFYYWGLGA